MFKTFKFFDHKGRRLSIFAEVGTLTNSFNEEKKVLKFTVITCSKKDRFIKAKATEMYENFKAVEINPEVEFPHPEQFILPVEEDKPKKTFINFCNKNYYRRDLIFIDMPVPVLSKDNGKTIQRTVINQIKFEFSSYDSGITSEFKN